MMRDGKDRFPSLLSEITRDGVPARALDEGVVVDRLAVRVELEGVHAAVAAADLRVARVHPAARLRLRKAPRHTAVMPLDECFQ